MDPAKSKNTLVECQKCLKSFLAGECKTTEVIEALTNLLSLKVTIDELKTTQIGRDIRKLQKSTDESIKTLAGKIEALWMSLAEQASQKRKREDDGSGTPPPKRVAVPSATTPAKGTPLNSSLGKSRELLKSTEKSPALRKSTESATVKKDSPQHLTKSADSKLNAPTSKKTEEVKPAPTASNANVPSANSTVVPVAVSDFKGSFKDNQQRNAIQVKLWQALGPCLLPGGIESTRLATDIEAGIHTFAAGNQKNYAAKFRMLFINLNDKNNHSLRDSLFRGLISVQKLMTMSSEELASPQLQAEREALETFATECRKPQQLEATCESFTCEKCDQNKTSYYQLQIRSADEPMTTFITCCNCGYRWTFE